MRIHYLQHVAFEDLGSMEQHLLSAGHRLSCTRLDLGQRLPDQHEFDWLIIMGGPMGVADQAEYPWLMREQEFIQESIEKQKIVLGICLGAQLIAAALGARIRKNRFREIGWFPLERHPDLAGHGLARIFPSRGDVFHWHGETFDLPAAALPLASSTACKNQGFLFSDRVLALQFHLEVTPVGARKLIDHCADELDGSNWVQTADEILAEPNRFTVVNQLMADILDHLSTLKPVNDSG